MAAAAPRKYAGLPDLDDAPDVYETPDLTEDAGTTTAASGTFRTSSRTSSHSDGEGTGRGIDRHRLDQDAARARFVGSRVDARRADFSDRLGSEGARKDSETVIRSYVVSNSSKRRRRHRQRQRRQAEKEARQQEGPDSGSGDEEDEDEDTDSEDDGTPEGLRRKLARLNREAAELHAEMERIQQESGVDKNKNKTSGGTGLDDEGEDGGVAALDRSLATLNSAILHGQSSAHERLAARLGRTKLSSSTEPVAAGEGASDNTSYTIAYAPSYDSAHALARAAVFDDRLAALEAALGVERMPLPTQEDTATTGAGTGPAFPKPVLPTLDILDKQLAVLAASALGMGTAGGSGGGGGAALDTIASRVSQLTRDAEKLTEARQRAKEAHEALKNSWTARGDGSLRRAGAGRENGDDNGGGTGGRAYGGSNGVGGGVTSATAGLGLDDPELVARVNALHGALPTIEALAPVLPGLLDRLRSLRLVHADAAGASKSVKQLEERQAEVDTEIAEWRESLAKVAGALDQGEEGVKGNMKVIEGWVRELEGRVSEL